MKFPNMPEPPFPVPNDSPFFVDGIRGPQFKIDDGQAWDFETVDNWPQSIKKLAAIVAIHHYAFAEAEDRETRAKNSLICQSWLNKQL